MAFSFLALAAPGDWAKLEARLNAEQVNPNIPAILVRRLQELSAKSVLIEDNYLDKDFSEAYSAYYSKTFRRHTKLCTRLLFFASDVSFVNSGDAGEVLEKLEASAFIGQIVLRPISQAPVGQALFAPPPPPANHEGHLLVRGEYSAHVFGAELKVEGVPMTQQDSRVGACAQASIWIAARHFHVRHRGPWLSTVSITKAAVAHSEAMINTVVPAGSEFLSVGNMVAAMRHAGREPLIYAATGSVAGVPTWGSVRPADVINRYVDSGIPVITGLTFPGQNVGHAIVTTGQVLRQTPSGPLPSHPTRAEYCETFYANDDQLGPNIRVGLRPNSPLSEANYSIEANVNYLIIPLPEKVYLPAEKAEALAWGSLISYAADWPAFKARHAGKLGTSEQLGDVLVGAMASNTVVARTYLTYGWKYKKRGIRNRFSNPVKQVIRNLEVPRFVYVTEFATTGDTDGRSQFERRIVAHCVVDATAKNQGQDSVLLVHAPGFCSWYAHDQNGSYSQSVGPVQDSTTYFPKARGLTHFTDFAAAGF
ncbi:hypothetical protein [Mesorhizobium sp. B1-1-5]|uniref:hypothetical protein n=1 Tax=Mesorhizobium sp. B1-1-5 TaxID=2589979 RepID=UPI00112BBBA7|nr:hypothetical protein [Mesorhizobium sp. B1-1-5]TPO05165.1 hypothetical protein FJ980_14940 [Mesorhizobium sp. B1-1-5]